MKKKILFVVTSHDRLGNTNNPTGYYLSEVSHPWSVLISAGYEIDFVSPKGGKAPAEAVDLTDEINKAFWENSVYRFKIEHTLNPQEVNPVEYIAVFYAGGHGVMWDYPNNQDLGRIAQTIYENGGVVSAVCHAPAALLNVKLSNGELLIKGRKTLNPQLHSRSATYIKRNGLLIRKITIKSSRPFQCAYHPLTP